MKQYLLIFFIALSAPFLTQAEEIATPIHMSLKDDGRDWIKVKDENLNGQGIVEFMLKYEDKAHWTELVTLQYFWSEDIEPKQLLDAFIQEIQKQAGSAKVTKKILKEDNKDVMAEWSIEGTPNDQYELIRIMSNGKVVGIVRYTTKKGRVPEKNLEVWKKILQGATFAN